MGFTGQVARIHGGMGTQPNPLTRRSEHDEQVAFFKRSTAEGGARFLVATDAAGEGINLQSCWLMVNYDIPWNPARLEQRMGRIHRYGQRHDPVVIINLVAGKTREGRVIKVLLEKLEAIRKELRSDKVFDVVGRLFEGVSLRVYLECTVTDEGAELAARQLTGKLTPEQVAALAAREQRLYGDGGDVRTIEVKGRAGSRQVEITENEWARACNLDGHYWLYVVYDCATPHPRLVCVKDPFWRLIAQAKWSMLINMEQILMTAE